jgi:hypothetical protein
MSEKTKEYFKNFEIKTICSICVDSVFFLHSGNDAPKRLSCSRPESRKFDCTDYSGFKMKTKLDWFKFRVANMDNNYWEYYRTAKYKQGTGEFEDLKEVEIS